jgi:hypothetical protein
LEIPVGIVPAGTKIVGSQPNRRPPISSPGTILSHMPSMATLSYIAWLRPTAAESAMTSRLNSDSSMPSVPCVTPSHIAGVLPATCTVAPTSRAQTFICGG